MMTMQASSMEEDQRYRVAFRCRDIGYGVEAKLADALKQYADRPQDVRAWVDELLTYDES